MQDGDNDKVIVNISLLWAAFHAVHAAHSTAYSLHAWQPHAQRWRVSAQVSYVSVSVFMLAGIQPLCREAKPAQTLNRAVHVTCPDFLGGWAIFSEGQLWNYIVPDCFSVCVWENSSTDNIKIAVEFCTLIMKFVTQQALIK